MLASTLVLSVTVAARLANDVGAQSPNQPGVPPEARAVAFLAREVPRWRADEGCYSCHNNGDGARALMMAARAGYDVAAPIADTLAFLARPRDWESGPRGPMEDKVLSRIQFALALTTAVEGRLAPAAALADAARRVAADQQADGSWRLDASGSLGSPATYGTALATWAARRSLAAADHADFAAPVERADAWLRARRPQAVVDAAAVALAFAASAEARSVQARDRARAQLLAWQAPNGAWGPYADVRAEPFDTAIAVLALAAMPSTGDSAAAIARGRTYLRAAILADGSWPETTRPAGQQSYAQLISTSAWATMALLELRDRPRD
jgi:hypothetical protein